MYLLLSPRTRVECKDRNPEVAGLNVRFHLEWRDEVEALGNGRVPKGDSVRKVCMEI